MARQKNSPCKSRRIGPPGAGVLLWAVLGLTGWWGTVEAGDIFRIGPPASLAAKSATGSTSGATTPTTTGLTSSQDRLARTTQALAAVQQMQQAARILAIAGANNLKASLPAVPVNSFGVVNGLVVAAGVPKVLSNPAMGENVALWTGASLPQAMTQTTGGTTTSTVTITQTQQQAVLNWQSFNIGKSTTLNFDQSAGGANSGQWIAFNKIGVTGSPSQILGSITAPGQVYVINPNGIIFGGSSQVNTHALVASSLPINGNLISRGLLNNPDFQFMFSALPLAAGPNGTPAFTPAVSDSIVLNGPANTYTLDLNLATGTSPVVSYVPPGAAAATLTLTKDFTVDAAATGNQTTLTFTPAGLKKIAGATVTATYTPAGDQYGNVEVQAGAQLTAPTTSDHVGGRIALIGPNVTNAGTISTADGQTILAAGLQVGFAAHATSDASLRGLDVYVGAVGDPALNVTSTAGTITNTGVSAGTVTNASLTTANIGVAASAISNTTTNAGGLNPLGLIEAPRADVFITGQNVNQLGVIDSSTSVSYNGRIDLLAAYNALTSQGFANSPPFFRQNTGAVILGSGSVARILPELASTDTIVGTTLALPSQVNLTGTSIQLTGGDTTNPGATLLAPNASVTANAGSWKFTSGGLDPKTGTPQNGTAVQFIYDTGQISAGTGATIDVSGSQDVSASVAENIVSVQLRGPELANSPVQRNGPLRGQTIQVDIRQTGTYNGTPWVGTPLASTSGYIGLIQRSVGELTVGGGNVTLNAGGGVTLQKGSSINVSGGWINYQGADIQTTKLVASNGHIFDVSLAIPDQLYTGIYAGTTTTTDPKWGVTQASTNPLSISMYDPGYAQGGSGGKLAITAPAMTLAGTMTGQTFPGARQINPFIPLTSPSLQAVTAAGIDPLIWELGNLPVAGTLSLTFEKQYAQTQGSNTYLWFSPAPPDIYIQPGGSTAPTDPRALVLSSDLVDTAVANYGGFGNLVIDNSADNFQIDITGNTVLPIDPKTTLPVLSALSGSITVGSSPANRSQVILQTAPGGSITFDAGNIDLEGGVIAPGGQLNFTAHDFWQNSTYNITNNGVPKYDPMRGNMTVGAGVNLSTAGVTVDQRQTTSSPGAGPLVTTGGTIAIAGSNVTFGAGSMVNVGGGAAINAAGKVAYGAGGTISLKAGADPSVSPIIGGGLVFKVSDQTGLNPNQKPLQGYSGGTGGTLSLTAPLVEVGAVAGVTAPTGTLVLTPDFFSNGGFSTFSLQGLGRAQTDAQGNILTDGAGNTLFFPAVYVAPGTVVHPRVQEMQVAVSPGGYQSQIFTPPAYENTPVSLTLAAIGISDPSQLGLATLRARGDLLVGVGAVIQTDPQSNPAGGVTLTGQTVAELGSVIVPGGAISIKGGADSTTLFANTTGPLPTVDLGPKSVLSTAGTTVLVSDPSGHAPGAAGYLNTGSVLPGGTITIDGNVVAEKGAVLDVSGWSDTKDAGGRLNLAPVLSGGSLVPGNAPQGLSFVPTVVDSNAGSITFKGRQELFTDATLTGAAGGPAGTGGSLSVSSGGFNLQSPLDVALQVTATGPTIPAPFYGLNQTAIGQVVVDAKGNPVTLTGNFAASSFSSGGFESLALHGTVSFHGLVNIAAPGNLLVGDTGIIYADAAVSLGGTYVALGQSYLPPVLPVQQNNGIYFNGASYNLPPTSGSGTLTVTAGTTASPGLVDIGNLSLQKIGLAAIVSNSGDIRGYGTFDIAGALSLTAGQVYPVTAEDFTVAAYDYHLPTDKTGTIAHPGSVTFLPSGSRQVPLSAGGSLNIYAQNIDQGGVLRAPVGAINLGWNGSGTAPVDPITNAPVPVAKTLTLEKGSVASVVGAVVDPVTGQNLPIPYGFNLNGTQWVDPTGADITSGGLAAKTVRLSAGTVDVTTGAVIDTSGGGDLYAYQFIPGVGGTNDILTAASASFAVLPGYLATYAPDARFNTSPSTSSLTNFAIGDLGYASLNSSGSSRLALGDQIHIDLGNGLGVQNYTLMPARYALLPGAYLITPVGGLLPSVQAVAQPDGSTIAAGYRFNAFTPSQPLYSEFNVASASVARTRAQYADFSANTFFTQNATSAGTTATRLPVDGGQLVISATTAMTLQGSVSAAAATGGRGGLVDISSPGNVVINGTGTGSAAGTLYLDASVLSTIDAGSLLIGGTRSTGTAAGMAVNVTAGSLTVDNAGQPLTGADVILVANNSMTLAPGAQIAASGTLQGPADALQVSDSLQLQPATGDFINLVRGGTAINFPQGTPTNDTIKSTVAGTITLANGTTTTLAANKAVTLAPGSSVTLNGPGKITAGLATTGAKGGAIPVVLGDGTLLRVSSAASAPTSRSGVSSSTAPVVQVGAGAKVTGASVTLDSTYATNLDPTAVLTGGSIALDSGQISLVLNGGSTTTIAPSSLVLSGTALANLQTGATGLSLFSYSSIDTYGTGQVGTAAFSSLGLHAGEIRGFGTGASGQVAFSAQNITVDNSTGGAGPGPATGTKPAGTLTINAGTITLGANQTAIDQFANVQMTATGGILAKGSGALTTPANLTMTTPMLTGAAGASQTITAGGTLNIAAPASGTAAVTGGLGASLTLIGSNIAAGSKISLPSGALTLHATGPIPTGTQTSPDVSVAGAIDVSGTAQVFQGGLAKYTDAGQVTLISDNGSVDLAQGASIKASAQVAGGSAGSVSVSAPNGTFAIAAASGTGTAPLLDASNGPGGIFTLDVANLSGADGKATTSVTALETVLASGNFTQSQSIRVRSGDVKVDGTVKAATFNLSSDQGSIDVTAKGFIDASGATGGAIDLAANGSITLESGSELSVKGQNFNSAGKGGTVSLGAGSYTTGKMPSTGTRSASGRFGAGVAVVDVQSGATIDLSVVNNRPMELNASGTSFISIPVAGVGVYFPSGTPGNDQVAFTTSGTITTAGGVATPFSATPGKPYTTALALGSTVTLTGAGTITFASGTGGSVPVSLPSSLADGTALTVVAGNTTDLTAYNATGTLHLRAPQVLDASGNPYDIEVNPINGKILNPSSIAAEGYQVFDLTATGGLITDANSAYLSQPSGGAITDPNVNVQASVGDNGALFAGGLLSTGGTATGNTAAITTQLLAGNPAAATLTPVFHVRPGAEIINTKGDITLQSTWDFAAGAVYSGTGDPAVASNWDLTAMPYRFGPSLEPGYLNLSAQGNIVFSVDPNNANTPASLNDGFAGYTNGDNYTLWTATLLPAGIQSWSYRLVAGADFSAADSHRVLPGVISGASNGSVLLGKNVPVLPTRPLGNSTSTIIPEFFQTIRTGTGGIDIYARSDVQLLNNVATIYTAGAQTAPLPGFDLPASDYPAQYSSGGGDLTIVAQGNITHLTATGAPDSSKELPVNWLNRRGWVDPLTSQFASPRGDSTIDSTSWWIDFSNFFEGVGALGGGNVTLSAGHNISNIDAVVPTNERTTRQTNLATTTGTNVDKLAVDQPTLELGGGNLFVHAGGNLDGGVYYVERGIGMLNAGGTIHTNNTRAALGQSQSTGSPLVVSNPDSWLPTTLFLGNGSFTLRAGSDLLLGPVANPFLLPQAYVNGIYEKNYFSTYATSDSVNISSLTGTVTLKDHPDSSGLGNGGSGSLTDWINRVLFYSRTTTGGTFADVSQPWLRLIETDLTSFTTVTGVMPSSLYATAFGGDINLAGSLTLSPSSQGQVALVAEGSINGMQPNSANLANGISQWGSSEINLSDANPTLIPGVISPLALAFSATGLQARAWLTTNAATLNNINSLFNESGSVTGTYGVIQTKQALHAPGPLHANDSNPVLIYATAGDISGLTLFAGKSARVIAGQDITDIALYVQNIQATDTTIVAAGRDLIPYDSASPLRAQVQTVGDSFVFVPSVPTPASGSPTAGDIQIGGPGTLEVFAGRNLALGVGAAAPDGTSVGIRSIGNTRNPSLPFGGANIVAGAGIAGTAGLDSSQLDFTGFINSFLNPTTAGSEAALLLPELGQLMGITTNPASAPAGNTQVWTAFNLLSPQQQDRLALDIFYLILRNAGRDHNNSQANGFGNYNKGYEAVATLFSRKLDYTNASGTGFVDQYLNPATAGSAASQYLPSLGALLGATGVTDQQIWQQFNGLPADQQHALALDIFNLVLMNAAQQLSNAATNVAGKAAMAHAVGSLFNGQLWQGNISLATREIETTNGGDITVLAPGGAITVGQPTDPQKPDQGILTGHGGSISIFASGNVNVGTSRIFTLRGGNEIIWSSAGNIAAGSGSKTVFAAPPTRVLIDPQSADVQNDLAGLATGAGIGVLATLKGVNPGDVDLIAPVGTVDAGDAGIRSSGNLNIAAAVVLNASNIQVGGVSAGTPPPPPAPNLGSLTAASNASASANSAATEAARQGPASTEVAALPSLITVEVLGYGGGDDDNQEKKKKDAPAGSGGV